MRPLKRLSQNFLTDNSVSERIVEAACIAPGDTVIEIGPGTGALTRPLIAAGAQVIAIEVDGRAIPQLLQLPIRLIHADVMTLHLPDLIPAGTTAKVVANLPYHLTSPILEKIIPHHQCISQATLMVQKEVAERCAAQAGTKTFGHLTLFLQFYSTVRYCFEVGRDCFFPQARRGFRHHPTHPKAPCSDRQSRLLLPHYPRRDGAAAQNDPQFPRHSF